MWKLSILGIKKHIETHKSWPTTSHFHHLSSHTKRHDVSCGQIQGRLQNCSFVLKPNTSMRLVSLTKIPCAFYRGNMAYSCRLSITFIHHIEAFQLHWPRRTPRNEIAENLKAGHSKGNPMVRPAISGGGGIRDTLGGANDCPFCQLKPLHLQQKNEASKNDFKLFIPHKFRTCSYINKQTCI